MKEDIDIMGTILGLICIISLVVTAVLAGIRFRGLDDDIEYLRNNSCNCSINYGGHNMSVEDAFERAGEGLTVDQADEVEILIEEYCSGSK